jgi:hypothetical protein
MEVLIKRKNYDQALSFLNERSEDIDWTAFLTFIKSNEEFCDYFKQFLISLTCPFTLILFLNKLFSLNCKDIRLQETIYFILDFYLSANAEFSHNQYILNLFITHTVKISVLNPIYREKLENIIRINKELEQWFIDLLENFEFFQELGLLYELREDYLQSLTNYRKCNKEEKIIQLEIIIASNNLSPSNNESNLFVSLSN